MIHYVTVLLHTQQFVLSLAKLFGNWMSKKEADCAFKDKYHRSDYTEATFNKKCQFIIIMIKSVIENHNNLELTKCSSSISRYSSYFVIKLLLIWFVLLREMR